ncbi:MAG: hypothetical protein HYX23_00045 [Candidatus Zambryskibacteria bacterium]|nr:hypothetical protein [Candidatus Zambryskibacteria bacterium]
MKRIVPLLNNTELTEEDIVDSLISLHLILESGMNAFFRELVRDHSFSPDLDIFKHLDSINFIDKTSVFLYTFNFDFKEEDLQEREKYKNLISRLKNFRKMRNLLLHGHAVMRVQNITNNTIKKSEAKKIVDQKTLDEQIYSFKEIVDGMRFYIARLASPRNGSDLLSTTFLEYSFLPEKYKNK